MAVATGQCQVAVAWRARKRAAKASRPWAQVADRLAGHQQWSRPFGVLRPVDEIAILTRRAMHEYGYTRDHLANVALAFRHHAQRNPNATMGDKPLTREQYMDARWISEPLCLFDNCLETDGALAVVITSAERARDLRHPPVYIHSFAPEHPAAAPGDDQLLLRRPVARPGVGLRAPALGPFRHPARRCPRRAALRRVQPARSRSRLEGYGFCERGEGGAFTEDGNLEWPNGRLPTNTVGRRDVRGVRARVQPRARRRAAVPRDVDVTGRRRGVLPRHERRRRPDERRPVPPMSAAGGTGMESTWLLPDLDDEIAAPFWAGTARGELLVQTCASCGHRRMPPRPMCPRLPVARRRVGRDERRRHDLVVRGPPPAAAARVRGACAVQRDRRRARRGSDDPLRRQPRSPDRTARSTRSTPRPSRSASPSA